MKGEAAGKAFQPKFTRDGNRIKVIWTQPLVLKAGEKLALTAEF